MYTPKVLLQNKILPAISDISEGMGLAQRRDRVDNFVPQFLPIL